MKKFEIRWILEYELTLKKYTKKTLHHFDERVFEFYTSWFID